MIPKASEKASECCGMATYDPTEVWALLDYNYFYKKRPQINIKSRGYFSRFKFMILYFVQNDVIYFQMTVRKYEILLGIEV